MQLNEPIVIYTGQSNSDAWAAMQHLDANGIDAYVVENNAATGFSILGGIAGVHQPQVYVSKSDAPQANEHLKQYIELCKQRQANLPTKIEAVCEKCGETTLFSSSLDGTVQDCSHCGAYVEVGEFEDFEFSEDENV